MLSRYLRLFLAVAALVAASLACATVAGEGEEAAAPGGPAATAAQLPVQPGEQPREAPGNSTTPGAAPEPGAAAEFLDLGSTALFQAGESINTYQMGFLLEYAGTDNTGQAVSGKLTLAGDFSVSPEEYSILGVIESSAEAEMNTRFNVIYKNETVHVIGLDMLGGMCFATDTDEATPSEFLLQENNFLIGQGKRVLPDEAVDGRPVRVYEITQENLNSEEWTSNDFTLTDGRVYVDIETGFVLRFWMNGQGSLEMLSGSPSQTGDILYEMTITRINQPVDIQAPENCLNFGGGNNNGGSGGGNGNGNGGGDGGGDGGGNGGGNGGQAGGYPLLEGAFDQTAIAGMLTFSVDMALTEAAAQYKQAMLDAGYTLQMEQILDMGGTMMFMKDGKLTTVVVSSNPVNGATLITIAGE